MICLARVAETEGLSWQARHLALQGGVASASLFLACHSDCKKWFILACIEIAKRVELQ